MNFLNQLSEEKLVAIAKASTLFHYPKAWETDIKYTHILGEYKQYQKNEKPVYETEFYSTHGAVTYKIELLLKNEEPRKIGYVRLNDNCVNFFNLVNMDEERLKKQEIFRDFVAGCCIYGRPDEEESNLSDNVFLREMETIFGKETYQAHKDDYHAKEVQLFKLLSEGGDSEEILGLASEIGIVETEVFDKKGNEIN